MARPKTKALAKKAGVKIDSPTMTESLQAILDLPSVPPSIHQILKHLGIKKKPKNVADALNMVAVAQALNGSFSHYKEIFDRIDGRPISALEETDDEISLIFKVKKKSARVDKRKQAVKARLDEKDITPKTVEVKAKKVGRPKKTTKTKRTIGGKK